MAGAAPVPFGCSAPYSSGTPSSQSSVFKSTERSRQKALSASPQGICTACGRDMQ